MRISRISQTKEQKMIKVNIYSRNEASRKPKLSDIFVFSLWKNHQRIFQNKLFSDKTANKKLLGLKINQKNRKKGKKVKKIKNNYTVYEKKIHRRRRASRSVSRRERISPSRTGPFTLRMRLRVGSSTNSIETCVTPPRLPVRPMIFLTMASLTCSSSMFKLPLKKKGRPWTNNRRFVKFFYRLYILGFSSFSMYFNTSIIFQYKNRKGIVM